MSVKPMEANLSRRMECRVKKAAVRPSRISKSSESAAIRRSSVVWTYAVSVLGEGQNPERDSCRSCEWEPHPQQFVFFLRILEMNREFETRQNYS